MEKIIAALKQLNPKNDNHWADGLPKIEAVRFLAADQSLTKEQITQALPGFTRDQALPTVVTPKIAKSAVMGDVDEQEPDSVATDDFSLPEEESEDAKASLAQKLAGASQRLAGLAKIKAQVLKAYSEQDAKVNSLLEEVEKAGGKEQLHHHLAAYFKQQQESRQNRLERQILLKNSGIDLAKLLELKSPLDSAMSRKTRRGGQRTEFPILK